MKKLSFVMVRETLHNNASHLTSWMLAKSSLPVVRHAADDEQLAADNRLDRMQIWMNSIASTC
jgi:hypothetical protein